MVYIAVSGALYCSPASEKVSVQPLNHASTGTRSTKPVTEASAHGSSGTRRLLPITTFWRPRCRHSAVATSLRMPTLLLRATGWLSTTTRRYLVNGYAAYLPLRIGRWRGPGTAFIIFACAVQPKASKAFSDGFTSCAPSRDGRKGIMSWYWGTSAVNSPVSTGLTRTLAFVAVTFGDCLTSRFYDSFQRLPARQRE